MDPHNSKELYAIVQFDGANEKRKLCIDLVLKKWFITRCKKDMCKYPPENHYHLRDKFLKDFKHQKNHGHAFSTHSLLVQVNSITMLLYFFVQ